MTDTIETTENVFEAKARDLLLDAFTKNGAEERDGTITFEFKISDLVSAIAAALEAERLEERAACERIAIAMFEDCTTSQACSAIEAEMRDRLAAKDARIAELSSAVAGKVQLIEPDPETIAWAEGVFAAEDDKNARIAALEAALTPSEETKFAYMGEVNFWHTDFDEGGNEHRLRLDVPWTSIKTLMKLIRENADRHARSTLEGKQDA
jgi:hypothetical protein